MKKLIFVFLIAVLFAACTKNNESPALTPGTATAAGIAGQWKIVADTTSQVQQSSLKTNSIALPTEFMVYNANGTGYLQNTAGDITENFTFTIVKSVIKMINNVPAGGGNEQDLSILSISSSKMVLRGQADASFTDIGLIKQ